MTTAAPKPPTLAERLKWHYGVDTSVCAEVAALEAENATLKYNLNSANDALSMARDAMGAADYPFLDDGIKVLKAELARLRERLADDAALVARIDAELPWWDEYYPDGGEPIAVQLLRDLRARLSGETR